MRIALALSLCACLMMAQTGPAGAQARDPAYAKFDQAIEQTKAAMMADPNDALAKSGIALSRAEALPLSSEADVARATALWLRAEAFLGLGRIKDAQPLVATALALVEKSARGSKLHGDLMRSRGGVEGLSGNMQQALQDYLAAFGIFRAAKEVRSQAITLQDIGQIYFDAGDYPRVVRYYEQAQDLYDADPGFALTTHNNLGETYRMMRRFADAEREYGEALAKAREMKSAVLQTRVLNNLALVLLESGDLAAATRSADQALRLARTGEAAEWRGFVYGVMAQIAAARGDNVRAAELLELEFAGIDLTETGVLYKEAHQLGARVFEQLGKPQQALAHLKAFQRLDSETRTLTASASSQLLSARFDFTNQNLRIAQLKQGQLERDVKIERQRTQFRTTLFTALAIAGAVLMGLILIAFFSIRRSRNEVRDANAVLTVVNDKLEKALKAKTEFLATTSHEIRTPLNGILGMTQILLTNRSLDPKMRDQVQVVHGAGEAMRALVDDILDVAKMETGEIAVAHEPVAFRSMLEDAARLWSGHAVAKGLDVELDIAEAPRTIMSDTARLRQIVNNLLSNAVKFTVEGKVRLTSKMDTAAGMLLVEVEDTGIGIDQDQQDAVFEAFHQVDGGMNRQFSGTGLGLSICRKLAHALDGTISLVSTPGKGSTFRLAIPIELAEEIAQEASRSTVRPQSLSAARVVMVEANILVQGMLRAVLEPVCGSLDFVSDSTAALAALRTGTLDHLIIEAASATIDSETPLDALGTIVKAADAADVRSTILVAPSEDFPLGKVATLGAQLVMKPISGAQLVAALQDSYSAGPADWAVPDAA